MNFQFHELSVRDGGRSVWEAVVEGVADLKLGEKTVERESVKICSAWCDCIDKIVLERKGNNEWKKEDGKGENGVVCEGKGDHVVS